MRAKWWQVLRQQRQLVADRASRWSTACSSFDVVAVQTSSNSELVTCITLLKGLFLAYACHSLCNWHLTFACKARQDPYHVPSRGVAQQAASPCAPAAPKPRLWRFPLLTIENRHKRWELMRNFFCEIGRLFTKRFCEKRVGEV